MTGTLYCKKTLNQALNSLWLLKIPGCPSKKSRGHQSGQIRPLASVHHHGLLIISISTYWLHHSFSSPPTILKIKVFYWHQLFYKEPLPSMKTFLKKSKEHFMERKGSIDVNLSCCNYRYQYRTFIFMSVPSVFWGEITF